MRNKTTEVTEGHRERVFGIIEYIREEVAFVQVTYARLLSCCTFGDGEAELIVPPISLVAVHIQASGQASSASRLGAEVRRRI